VIRDQPYLFMEYVTGGSATSLRDRLRYGRLGVPQAMHFAYQLCLGMEFVNCEGEVAHGDLKPENLLIDTQNVLKITDFGLAHRIEVVHGKYARAEASTWAYAPPERFFRQPVDGRWDIFAFGVILYEMLTGKLPYPFELNRDPTIQFKQLSDFHERRGMRELSDTLDYHGIPDLHSESDKELGLDLGGILGDCLYDLPDRRTPDFKEVRRRLEWHFARCLPVASNELSPGFTQDPPAVNSDLSLTDLHLQALSLTKLGLYSQALSILNRLLSHYPEDGGLCFEAGINLLAIGDGRSAYEFLTQAIRLNPRASEALQLAIQLNPHLTEEQPWLKSLTKDGAE
jgi:serine/threonine protein kinase